MAMGGAGVCNGLAADFADKVRDARGFLNGVSPQEVSAFIPQFIRVIRGKAVVVICAAHARRPSVFPDRA